MQAAGADRPLAVITGASTGIGYELARIFAQEGFDLVVSAENPQLEVATRELRALMNRFQAQVGGRMLPDSAKAELHRKQAEPGSDPRRP